MLGILLASLFSAPVLSLAQDKAPEKLGTLDAGAPARSWTRRNLLFSADGKRLAFCTRDGVRLWEVAEGKLLGTLAEATDSYVAEFSPDGKFMAVCSEDASEIQLWNVETREMKRKATLDQLKGAHDLAFTKDGTRIVTLNAFSISVVAATTLQLISDFPLSFDLMGLHPDGKTLIVGKIEISNEPLLYVDLKSGAPKSCVVRKGEKVASFAVSPDGGSVVTYSTFADEKKPYELKVWDPKKAKQMKTLIGAGGFTGSVQISPDGKWVGAPGESLSLWSLKDGTRVFEDVTSRIPGGFMAFGPGGLIATWGKEQITVWRFP